MDEQNLSLQLEKALHRERDLIKELEELKTFKNKKKCPKCEKDNENVTQLLGSCNKQTEKNVEDVIQKGGALQIALESLRWIESDGYKCVPSHWKEIAQAQSKAAGDALATITRLLKRNP